MQIKKDKIQFRNLYYNFVRSIFQNKISNLMSKNKELVSFYGNTLMSFH